jgi:hypothetical protein
MSRDLYQPSYQFDIQQTIYQKILSKFPDLSTSTIDVLSRAIVNKLCEGVEYPNHLEEIIKKIYPIIFSTL